MRKLILGLLLVVGMALPVLAEEAPTPHRAPRTPVNRMTLAERQAAAAPARDIQAQATILDGERLRVGETDVRLFGIVPPQLSASFGPQARTALDTMVAGQPINCHVRDRDHDGRLLATCTTSSGADMALELLRRGLAVSARGSLADTDVATNYLAAEQAAQTAHLGLWSVTIPAAAPIPVAVAAPAVVEAPKPAVIPEAKVEAKPEPKVEARKEEVKKEEPRKEEAKAIPVVTPISPAVAASVAPVVTASTDQPGFFMRYQILIAGMLMLATVMGGLGTFAYQRHRDKRDEMKALAAALRGELQAARAVCQTRLKEITSEDDDRAASWPRLRSTLYQAYVGRIGWLGAELARQIASIYGQSSDYASYYNSTGEEGATTRTPKRQALQNLVHYIEAVLPRLTVIEETGHRLSANAAPALIKTAPVKSMPSMPVAAVAPPRPLAIGVSALSPVAAPASPATSTEETTASIQDTATPAPAEDVTAADANHEDGASALWSSLRRLARAHFSVHDVGPANDESATDYTTLIEQDIATFGAPDEHDDLGFGILSSEKKSNKR